MMTNESADFKARIECSLLRGIATSINTLTEEARFQIGKKRWVISVCDPAHVAMMELKIDVKNFEDYHCKVEGEIGVDIDKLLDAIRYIKDRDIVDIRTESFMTTRTKAGEDVEVEVHKLRVNDGLCTRRFNLVDTTGISTVKPPKLELKTQFEMTWVDFQNILKRFQTISDHIFFKAFEGGIEISAEGEIDECIVKKPKELLVSYKYGNNADDDRKDHVRSIFPLNYLSNPFSNGKKIGMKSLFNHERWLNVMKFSMDQDYPIRVEAERNGVSILWYLAPRIESE